MVSNIIYQIDKISLGREYEFITAKINEEVLDGNMLNLKIIVSESEKKYVEKINITGNDVTQERVIRDQLEVDEGDPLNELLHAKSVNNLKYLGIFKNVDASIKDGKEENTKIIDIKVEEKPTGELALGAGVGSEGSSIGFSVTENNYLGRAIKLKTSIDISDDSIKGQFAVVNPNFNYSDKSLSTNVQSIVTDKLTKSGYKSSKTGFSFGTSFEQYEDLTIRPTFSSFVEKLETNSSASATLKKQEGDYFDTTFGYSLLYDKRNRRFKPTDGYLSNFLQSIPLIADDRSILNGYDFAKYNSWGDELVTSFSLYTRAINSLDDTKDVRISERLSLPRSKLKGFQSAKVGPKDGTDYIGGNYAASLNFSSNIPMLLPSVETFDVNFFVDAGNVWGVDYSSTIDDSNKIRSSTGLGVDWWTPIGPLSFTLAQPISKASTDKTQAFQFNIGTTF
jgi:outer membrane protein insertion porin family